VKEVLTSEGNDMKTYESNELSATTQGRKVESMSQVKSESKSTGMFTKAPGQEAAPKELVSA
jgi:hypothetical protein